MTKELTPKSTKRPRLIGLTLIILGGCVTPNAKQKVEIQPHIRPRTYGAKHISMHDLVTESSAGRSPSWISESQISPTAILADVKKKGAKAHLQASLQDSAAAVSTFPSDADQVHASPRSQSNCRTTLERLSARYRALMKVLPQEEMILNNPSLQKLLTHNPEMCLKPRSSVYALRILQHVFETHSGRIGLVLPLTGKKADQSLQILHGIRAAFKEAALDFDKFVILKDSGNTTHGAEVGFAELVLKNNVELVIGGLEQGEAEILAQWGASLHFPTLVLSPNPDLASLSPAVFVLYPNQKKLAQTLAQAAISKNKRKIAILKPTTGHADHLSDYFKESLTSLGGSITTEITYVPGNFDSMQNAAKALFKIDAHGRSAEFKEAYEKAKRLAAEEHVPFNPKEVLLPPIIDFDALFLPDDFRSVRHFAKLFKFHMANKLTLIGSHEWRSLGLVDPPDDTLNGAFFGDFVGSYASLPASLDIPRSISPWFTDPDLVAKVDFRLIGYRAAKVATAVISENQPKRSKILDYLKGMSLPDPQNGQSVPVFDHGRVAQWPTYVFRVTKDQLSYD